MTFHFKTIYCAICEKTLGSITAKNHMDSAMYCPDCVIAIEGLRYIIGVVDRQDIAKALMDSHFHKHKKDSLLLFDVWHARMRMAVEQLGLKLDYANWKKYRL